MLLKICWKFASVQLRWSTLVNGLTDQNLKVVERFRRVDADTILYQATVDDSTVYTKPWTVEISMTKRNERIFEYACHEGNYGMFGILSGARAQEAQRE